jgi:hypothetical protein
VAGCVVVRHGVVGSGPARQARPVPARYVPAWPGMAGQARLGLMWRGRVGYGVAGMVRHGGVWLGSVRWVTAGQAREARHGQVRSGAARQASHGQARYGMSGHGEARPGRQYLGMVGLVQVRLGAAGKVRQVKVCLVSVGLGWAWQARRVWVRCGAVG